MTRKKKKLILIIISVLLVICLMVCVLIYSIVGTKMRLKRRVDELVQSSYSYEMDISISGIESKNFGESLEGTLTGRKYEDRVFGEFSMEDSTYFEIYMSPGQEVMFNAKPWFTYMLEQAGDKTGLPVGMLSGYLDDVFVSLSQLQEITGYDVGTKSGDSAELFRLFDADQIGNLALTLKEEKKLEICPLGEEAYYYSIENDGTKVILGIPKKEETKTVSVQIYKDELVMTLVGDYVLEPVAAIEIPESTLSKTTIDILTVIYDCWAN